VAKEFSRKLFENGVFAMALGFPTVPKGAGSHPGHEHRGPQREDLDTGLAAFEKVGESWASFSSTRSGRRGTL